MNVSPVQNNNSQSFGMAFHLKGDGAKKLATLLDDVNPVSKKHIMEDLIYPIRGLKSKVTYDGNRVTVEPPEGFKITELSDLKFDNEEFIATTGDRPYCSTGSTQYVSFPVGVGRRYDVKYPNNVEDISRFAEPLSLSQKLLSAREIAKDLDSRAAKKAYENSAKALKQARVDELAKKLQDLFG